MKIAWQIRCFGLGLVLATACAIGLIVYGGYIALIENQQRKDLSRLVEAESRRIASAFSEVEHDTRLLSRLPGVRSIRSAYDVSVAPDGDTESDFKDQLASVFMEMARAKEHYAQIRFIGVADGGREVVRVNRRGERVWRTPASELQQKCKRGYFRAALALPRDGVYFSRIDLNREYGVIEIPHRPMLRTAVPVHLANGRVVGIVIINLNFQSFIHDLIDQDRERFSYYIANAEGDFLVHPDETRAYGFDLGKRFTLQQEFPDASELLDDGINAATVRSRGKSSSLGRLVNFRKVRIFPDDADRYLLLGISETSDDLRKAAAAIALRALGLTGAMVGLALVAAYLMASLLTRPLKRVSATAIGIAHGATSVRLPTDRKDEIGTLARAFDKMITAIRDREERIVTANALLVQANEDLEHFVHIASHDLREPARAVSALADLLMVEEQDHVSSSSQELLGGLRSASQRMLDQVTDLRSLANIGQATQVRKECELNELVQSILVEFSNDVRLRRVTVEIQDLPVLHVYENLIRVLYRNLVRNALQHVPSDGFTLSVTSERAGDEWILGLRNTGARIEPHKLRKIFAPFIRLDRRVQRSGMGLSFCKRIIDRHFGRIWVESGGHFVHVKFTFGEDA